MKLLAFDTCFSACSAAIRVAGPDAAVRQSNRFEPMTKGHAEALFPMIDSIMQEIGAGYADLDAIAVTIGPGSFTGTRVGISAARGLALATGLPVQGATSLAAIAGRTARRTGWSGNSERIMVCHDARRDQVYVQVFDGLDVRPETTPAVMSMPAAAPLAVSLRPQRIAGTAAQSICDSASLDIEQLTCPGDDGLPDAEALLDLWREHLDPPQTLYLRAPDAKPQHGKAIGRAS